MAEMDLQVLIEASSAQAVKAVKELSTSILQVSKDAAIALKGLLSFEAAGKSISSFGQSLDSASKQMKKFGRDFTQNVTAPLLAIGALSLKKIFDDAVLGKGTEATNQFAGSVQQLKKQFDALLVTIGTQLIPVANKIIAAFNFLIASYQSLSPATKDLVLTFGLIAASVGPIVLAVSSLVGILGKLAGVIGPVISGLGAFASAIATPAGLIVVLVGALVGLTNVFFELREAGEGTAEALRSTFYLFVTGFNNIVAVGLLKAIRLIIDGFNSLLAPFSTTIKTALDGASASVTEGINTLNARFDANKGAVDNKLKTIGSSAGNAFTLGLVNGLGDIKTAFNQATADTGILMTKQMEETGKKAIAIAQQVKESFAGGLANAMIEFSSGAETAGRAFEKFASSFLKQIAQMILQAQILNLLQGFSGFNSAAGAVGTASAPRALADGGYVTGPGTARSDSIPAWLSNGEFVNDAKTVAAFGPDFFHNLKSMARKGHGMKSGRPAFAEGGMVTNPGQAPQVNIQNTGSPKQVERTSVDPVTGVTTIILADIEKNGPISKGMQNVFGMRRGNFK